MLHYKLPCFTKVYKPFLLWLNKKSSSSWQRGRYAIHKVHSSWKYYLSETGPSFHSHPQIVSPSHLLGHSHPNDHLCGFKLLNELCSFQRKRTDSWLHHLSSPLSWWVGNVAASAFSCLTRGKLSLHSYFNLDNIQILNLFKEITASSLKECKMNKKTQWLKVEYFQVIVALKRLTLSCLEVKGEQLWSLWERVGNCQTLFKGRIWK